MKRLILILILSLLLISCSMTNDEIIAERQKCLDAGMGANLVISFDNRVLRVICVEIERRDEFKREVESQLKKEEVK